ncbi:hypothetical protein HYH03_017085 [Edaphochlamys debaryana]|uniref:Uncharacterized protein n=1 Tax=Edaphochlamys debaryana TaxID=47281 RepID=A0A835XIL3_9CHLO|nr:hypothetical protein HYH03_017085 [Edaphochlamys debaryana]|eukprot:KAG2484065.1 hypothetical protein HYH03_017085 [Edaphochlamys debaryana]
MLGGTKADTLLFRHGENEDVVTKDGHVLLGLAAHRANQVQLLETWKEKVEPVVKSCYTSSAAPGPGVPRQLGPAGGGVQPPAAAGAKAHEKRKQDEAKPAAAPAAKKGKKDKAPADNQGGDADVRVSESSGSSDESEEKPGKRPQELARGAVAGRGGGGRAQQPASPGRGKARQGGRPGR